MNTWLNRKDYTLKQQNDMIILMNILSVQRALEFALDRDDIAVLSYSDHSGFFGVAHGFSNSYPSYGPYFNFYGPDVLDEACAWFFEDYPVPPLEPVLA